MPSNANTAPAISYHQTGHPSNIQRTDSDYIQDDPFVALQSPYQVLSFPSGPQIKLQSRVVSFTPNVLGNTTHIYTTPDYNDIVQLAQYFADWQCSYSIQEGAVHTITVQAPWDTITSEDWWISPFASEQWELIPQTGTKSLLYSGLLSSSFDPPTAEGNYQILPLALQSAVSVAIKNGNAYINYTGSTLSSTQKTNLAPFIPLANKILMYTKAGIEGIPSYTQVLKRTACVDINNKTGAFQTEADSVQQELNDQGTVNFVYSTPDLLKQYDIPADTIGKFLPGSYYKVLGITYGNLDPLTYRAYAGWLVKPPTIQFIGRNKIQFTQEFEWNEWAEGLYYIRSAESDFGEAPLNTPIT